MNPQVANRDQNNVTTLLARSSVDGSIVTLYADPITHRLLVDLSGGGSGSVTSVSVVTANGFAGTVANPTSTPAITLETTVTGLLLGDGTMVTAAPVTGTGDVVLDQSPTLVTPTFNGATGTADIDFGGASTLEIPHSATPTMNADGQIAIDTSVSDFLAGILKYYANEEMGVVAMPIAQFTNPQDGYVPAYNAANEQFELVPQSGGGGGNPNAYAWFIS